MWEGVAGLETAVDCAWARRGKENLQACLVGNPELPQDLEAHVQSRVINTQQACEKCCVTARARFPLPFSGAGNQCNARHPAASGQECTFYLTPVWGRQLEFLDRGSHSPVSHPRKK